MNGAFTEGMGMLRERAGIEYEALELNKDYSGRTLRAVSESLTLPQVFINGARIGGADDLKAWLASTSDKAA